MAERRKGEHEPPHLCRKLARVALASGDGRQRKLGLAMIDELDGLERRRGASPSPRPRGTRRRRVRADWRIWAMELDGQGRPATGTAVSRAELAELDAFRYADGSRIRRGDLVRVPSEGEGATYRVIGFDTGRAAVVATDPLGRRRDIPRDEVAREL